MRVSIRSFGVIRLRLRELGYAEIFEIDLPEASKVSDFLNILSLGDQKTVVVSETGKVLPQNANLSQGMTITLLSPMSGG